MTLSRRMILAGASTLPFARAGWAASPDTARMQDLLDAAQKAGGEVVLPAGVLEVEDLRITSAVTLTGVPGRTFFKSRTGAGILSIDGATNVTLRGIGFQSDGEVPSLVSARKAEGLAIEQCSFLGGQQGLSLERASGRVSASRFRLQKSTALFSIDAEGLTIAENTIDETGNNGIQVWRSEKGEDGTIVTGNHVARVAATAGGTGENGNAINIYRAGNVTVSNNRLSDCAFSAIRNNSGDFSIITGNSISRCDEVAIYAEFSFVGAAISNNIIEDVCFGISITNFNEGGRLATCTGNLVRRARGGGSLGVTAGGGIYAEADTVVANNVVEDARDFGIGAGFGPYLRNVAVTGNTLKDCGKGIIASVTPGAGFVSIANNIISGAKHGAIIGMDHDKVMTGDLALDSASAPSHMALSGNLTP